MAAHIFHIQSKLVVVAHRYIPNLSHERLFTPRLKTPRLDIFEGAVGIGGEQTGIYPIASPGGWKLIFE